MRKPNSDEKQWLDDIVNHINDYGLGFYGDEFEGRTDFQIHHVLGRTAKQNKVEIGHWFILPVPIELHAPGSNHPDNVTHFKHNFTRRYGNQRDIFESLMESMFDSGYPTPNDEVYHAIMSTRA